MPGSYERVTGSRVGPWPDREATRSACEAGGHPGVGDLRGRGEEKAFVRGCSLSCHRCWVLLPPLGCGVSRGAGARRVWCVAPSLTLVLGPSWWCWSGDMMIDRVSPRRGAAASFFEGRPPRGGGDRLTAGSRPRSHQVLVGVTIASSCGLRPPRRLYRRVRAGCDASGGRSYEPPRWWPVCGRYGP